MAASKNGCLRKWLPPKLALEFHRGLKYFGQPFLEAAIFGSSHFWKQPFLDVCSWLVWRVELGSSMMRSETASPSFTGLMICSVMYSPTWMVRSKSAAVNSSTAFVFFTCPVNRWIRPDVDGTERTRTSTCPFIPAMRGLDFRCIHFWMYLPGQIKPN